MHTQKENALYLKRRKAHYVFQIKGNQKNLFKTCKAFFPQEVDWDYKKEEKGHGRIETRTIKCHILTRENRKQIHFPYCCQIICMKRERIIITTGELTTEISHYITSLNTDPETLFTIIRNHWHIENKLHWVRDVTFDEDRSQVRTGSGPRAMAILRNLAMGILRLLGVPYIAEGLRYFTWNKQLSINLLT